MGRGCSVVTCGRRRVARGWCGTHYARWRAHGDPLADVPVTPRVRANRGAVSYGAALQRVRARRGPARAQACAVCRAPAVVWCYDGAAVDERVDPRGRRYSLDPDRYRPCCRFCHRRTVVDRGAELPTGAVAPPALDVERAARLYRAGASSTGIGALLRVSPSAVINALRKHGVDIRTRPKNSITR